jgi:hypothetical protein
VTDSEAYALCDLLRRREEDGVEGKVLPKRKRGTGLLTSELALLSGNHRLVLPAARTGLGFSCTIPNNINPPHSPTGKECVLALHRPVRMFQQPPSPAGTPADTSVTRSRTSPRTFSYRTDCAPSGPTKSRRAFRFPQYPPHQHLSNVESTGRVQPKNSYGSSSSSSTGSIMRRGYLVNWIKAWVIASTQSSWRPYGKAAHSSIKSLTQGQ